MQEVLLDLGLSSATVVEHGSGVSSFYLSKRSMRVCSFDADPGGGEPLMRSMDSRASALSFDLHLEMPNAKVSPESNLPGKWDQVGLILGHS